MVAEPASTGHVTFGEGLQTAEETDPVSEHTAILLGVADSLVAMQRFMRPMPDALKSYRLLAENFDTYILSTAPWRNPSAWIHKLEWVQKHLGSEKGDPAYKRLILTHHKNLNKGDFLIDDRDANGARSFEGEHIWFGKPQFPDWQTVVDYLLKLK